MNPRKWTLWAGALSVAVLFAAQAPAQNDQPKAKEGVEVQARGPVHEAFAEPAEARPQPGEMVAKKPPAPIEELPPEQKPAGDGVIWVPGYWAWDDDQTDYLWVSGCWRVPPPKYQWVPGDWNEVDGGWQWTAGYWAPSGQEEVTYLPAPPPSIDEGASTPAPDDTSIYVPGSWVYRETRYLWRPGFWMEYRPDWVWIPAHYIWTPAGYVFVDGHWDLALERRGLLFAPIRLTRALGADWVYVPQYCVQPDFLLTALFVLPSRHHYFFGDYFEDAYTRRGFVPWFDFRIGRDAFDPNFAYYRHRFNDREWDHNLRDYYAGRFSGAIPRPPRTLTQQNTVVENITNKKIENTTVNKNINITNIQNVNVLAPVTKINNTKVTGLASLTRVDASKKVETHVIKTEPVTKEHQAEARKAVTQFREVAQQRHQAEAKILAGGGGPTKATDPPKSTKIQLPTAPTTPSPGAKAPPAPPPPPPTQPKHEERPIPQHEPPKASVPPKNAATPPAKEPAKEPPKPAPKDPPPPKEPPKPAPKEPPPPPPKDPPKPPPSPPKEPPPAPKEPPKPPPPPPKEPPKPPPPPPKDPPKPPPPKEPPKDKPPKEP